MTATATQPATPPMQVNDRHTIVKGKTRFWCIMKNCDGKRHVWCSCEH